MKKETLGMIILALVLVAITLATIVTNETKRQATGLAVDGSTSARTEKDRVDPNERYHLERCSESQRNAIECVSDRTVRRCNGFAWRESLCPDSTVCVPGQGCRTQSQGSLELSQ